MPMDRLKNSAHKALTGLFSLSECLAYALILRVVRDENPAEVRVPAIFPSDWTCSQIRHPQSNARAPLLLTRATRNPDINRLRPSKLRPAQNDASLEDTLRMRKNRRLSARPRRTGSMSFAFNTQMKARSALMRSIALPSRCHTLVPAQLKTALSVGSVKHSTHVQVKEHRHSTFRLMVTTYGHSATLGQK